MLPDPMVVPNHGHVAREGNWYCLHCDNWRTEVNGILSHLRAAHDITNDQALRGEDYEDASGVLRMIDARLSWSLDQERIFALQVESLGGADDFEFEVGAGSGVPPYPKP